MLSERGTKSALFNMKVKVKVKPNYFQCILHYKPDSLYIEKILTIINFVFLRFLGNNMLHVLLFIKEDELTDLNEEIFEDDSCDEEQMN